MLQLLCLFFDGAQVILYRLPRVHPPVKAVVQPSPKPARKTEISNAHSCSFDDDDDLEQGKKSRTGCDYLPETVGGGRGPERSLCLAVSGSVQRVQVVCLICTKMTP